MEITLEHVTKHFKEKRGTKKAVEDVTLSLTPGVWGLLGANGSGKTTLMRMLCGIMKPTDGQICCDGLDISLFSDSYRERIGYLPQEFGFYPEFTVRQYLEYIAALKGLPDGQTRRKIDELLRLLSLEEVYGKRIVKLSGGMKRRVGIAQALLNDPELLILDEPTSGLDPGERVRFRNLLSEFAHDRIVLISTHIVSDVEYIATRNAVMKDGRILLTGTTQELVSLMHGKVYECVLSPEIFPRYEKNVNIVNLRNEENGNLYLRFLGEQSAIPGAVPCTPCLEDLFLHLFPQESARGEAVGGHRDSTASGASRHHR